MVSLSATESELMSYTKVSQTARFIQIFLKELFGIQMTSIVFEDNAGCIFLIKNHKAGGRVKHIDVKFFHCRDLWKRKQVLPYHVRSEENVADGMTKNQPEKLFKEHEPLIMKGGLPYRREDVEMALLGLTGEPTEGTGSGVSDRAGIG